MNLAQLGSAWLSFDQEATYKHCTVPCSAVAMLEERLKAENESCHDFRGDVLQFHDDTKRHHMSWRPLTWSR